MMPSNLRDVGRASGLLQLTRMAAFAGVMVGLSGMLYYGMDLRKYGVNRYNASSFTGHAFLVYDGLLLYRTSLIAGHPVLEDTHRRLRRLRTVDGPLHAPPEN